MPIIVEKLSYTYMAKSVNAHAALKNISLSIEDGEFLGLIGHTGSGKSTFIQQLNGLMQPTSGRVIVDGFDMNDKKQRIKGRALIGMVFQYPDYQLFDNTVLEDISFGPRNMSLSDEEVKARAFEAMELVGLDPAVFADKSPFELSGGEKRRAALAGIIAMRPKYLVLDEPMAGLDPSGRREVMNSIAKLRAELGCAVIMVSHSMEDIAKASDRIVVLNNGEIYAIGTPNEIFSRVGGLIKMGLDAPQAARLVGLLRDRGLKVPDGIYTNEQFLCWFREEMRSA